MVKPSRGVRSTTALAHHLQDRLVGDACSFFGAQAQLPVTAPVSARKNLSDGPQLRFLVGG